MQASPTTYWKISNSDSFLLAVAMPLAQRKIARPHTGLFDGINKLSLRVSA